MPLVTAENVVEVYTRKWILACFKGLTNDLRSQLFQDRPSLAEDLGARKVEIGTEFIKFVSEKEGGRSALNRRDLGFIGSCVAPFIGERDPKSVDALALQLNILNHDVLPFLKNPSADVRAEQAPSLNELTVAPTGKTEGRQVKAGPWTEERLRSLFTDAFENSKLMWVEFKTRVQTTPSAIKSEPDITLKTFAKLCNTYGTTPEILLGGKYVGPVSKPVSNVPASNEISIKDDIREAVVEKANAASPERWHSMPRLISVLNAAVELGHDPLTIFNLSAEKKKELGNPSATEYLTTEKLSAQLKAAWAASGLTTSEIATRFDTYSNLPSAEKAISGMLERNADLSVTTVIRYCNVFGLSLSQLIHQCTFGKAPEKCAPLSKEELHSILTLSNEHADLLALQYKLTPRALGSLLLSKQASFVTFVAMAEAAEIPLDDLIRFNRKSVVQKGSVAQDIIQDKTPRSWKNPDVRGQCLIPELAEPEVLVARDTLVLAVVAMRIVDVTGAQHLKVKHVKQGGGSSVHVERLGKSGPGLGEITGKTASEAYAVYFKALENAYRSPGLKDLEEMPFFQSADGGYLFAETPTSSVYTDSALTRPSIRSRNSLLTYLMTDTPTSFSKIRVLKAEDLTDMPTRQGSIFAQLKSAYYLTKEKAAVTMKPGFESRAFYSSSGTGLTADEIVES